MSDPQREIAVRWGELRAWLRRCADTLDTTNPQQFTDLSASAQRELVDQVELRLAAARRMARDLRRQLGGDDS